jgi:Glycosyl transferase family 2
MAQPDIDLLVRAREQLTLRTREPAQRLAPTVAPSLPRVTAIIPTTCRTQRASSLNQAIDSLLRQEGANVTVLVVVNGDKFDPELVRTLTARTDIQICWQENPGLPLALRTGREQVYTEFFCFLDDDDLYAPGALRARLAPMLVDSTVDAVVSNGYRHVLGVDSPVVRDIEAVRDDPVGQLMAGNWLTSCGGLYRTASVPVDFFDPENYYHEWTLVAFRLATQRRVAFIPDATFRIYDTPGSLSKTGPYKLATADTVRRMLSIAPRGKVRRQVRRKLGAAWHAAADHWLNTGNLAAAWRCHLRSLIQPGGLAYLLYSRKLVLKLFGVGRGY